MATPPRRVPETDQVGDGEQVSANSARITLGRVFRTESANYLLLLGTTLFLVGFGLIMVLSASLIASYNDNDGFFGVFLRQSMYAMLAIPLMLIISRMPARLFKTFTFPVLIVACILQALVVFTPLGVEIGGNRNWLNIGPIQFQPSEIIKLALVVWLGIILSARSDRLNDVKATLMPVFIVGGVSIGLVLLGGDLGTVLIMAAILFGALFYAGVRLRILLAPLVVGAVGLTLFAISSESRLKRISAYMAGSCTDLDDCWQTDHSNYALANGGIFGVGIGNSTGKWGWLPAADNDFIFAIIGEELGLLGAIVVLVLFIVLAIAFLRIIRASTNDFARITTAGVMVWVMVQALVNIAVVLGLIPVLGVPLPLISAGGTALVSTLIAIGFVLSFARDQHPVEVDTHARSPKLKR